MTRPNAVGCYIFAGGYSLGVMEQCDVLAHLEDGPFGVEASKRNHPQLNYHLSPSSWPLEKYKGVDLVYANPPCAPWSTANPNSKALSGGDSRVECFERAFSMSERLRPILVAIESVRGAWSMNARMITRLAAKAREHGYATTVCMHDGYDCGLPQHRKRAMFFVHRVELDLRHPNQWDLQGPRTVGEAWDGFEDEEPLYPRLSLILIELAKLAKPGENLRKIYDKVYNTDNRKEGRPDRTSGRPGFLWAKLDRAQASATLTGSITKIHPDALDYKGDPRLISAREMQLLCGYPADYRFVGTANAQAAQIAKAVTPPVGRWVGKVTAAAKATMRPLEHLRLRYVDHIMEAAQVGAVVDEE